MSVGGFQFAIDRGGTFTDVYAEFPGGGHVVLKLLSESPAYPDAPREGIRRVLAVHGGGGDVDDVCAWLPYIPLAFSCLSR
jgi:N-methylhydantoinase A/oxoprolinase/acetone carboxylase beta subunit